ncbi:MAG: chitobiase/beta-hexosaminidase C-terminal domain-containing protein [Eubacterium sp.]|nr:chitobiase/beta-hexosaminidase C-terminal domain-containing protein [Eubacterium sp.]
MKVKRTVRRLLSGILAVIMAVTLMPPYVAKAAGDKWWEDGGNTANSIQKAINNVRDGGTVSISGNADINEAIKIEEGRNVIIELNGYMINRHLASDRFEKCKRNGEVFWVGENATLTINGGKGEYAQREHKGRTSNDVWYADDKSGGSKNYTGGMIVGGGSTNGAGGIHMRDGATVNLNDVTVAGNMSDEYGGAVRMKGDGCTLVLNNSKIEYNKAEDYGGAVYIDSGNGKVNLLNGSTISNNNAQDNDGGAMYSNGSKTTVSLGKDCHMDYNVSGDHGGAIYFNKDYSTVELDDTATISNNKAKNHGGALFFNYSKVAVIGGKIENNTAGTGGGGIYLEPYHNKISDDSATISGVTLTGNKATSGDGGAIHIEQENTTVTGCTITNNTAGGSDGEGGGIYVYNDNATISGCTITNNTAGYKGGGVYVSQYENIALGGKLIIKNNTGKGKTQNLRFGDGVMTTYLTGAPTSGSEIGIYLELGGNDRRQISRDKGHYAENVFFSDIDNQHTEWNTDRILYMVKGAKPEITNKLTVPMDGNTGMTKDDSKAKVNGYPVYKGYFSFPSVEEEGKDIDSVFYYTDGYFYNDPQTYNAQLATMSLTLAMSGFNSSQGGASDYTYKSQNVEKLLSDIGVAAADIYISDSYTSKPGTDTIGVAIGKKNIGDGDVLVPISVRGAGYESEWAGNLTMGTEGEHKGFQAAAEQVFQQVQQYIQDYNLTQAIENGKVKFWITGYSRSAATANLAAKRLVDAYGEKNNQIFGYTFATPQGANSQSGLGSYPTIHNTINSNDVVPRVAPKLDGYGFAHYGVDHIIDTTDVNAIVKLKQQLKSIDPDIAFDDYYALATINYIKSSVLNFFGYKEPMISEIDTAGKQIPATIGGYEDDLLKNLTVWGKIPDRSYYAGTASSGYPGKGLGKDGEQPYSVEETLRVVAQIMFSKTAAEQEQLMAAAKLKANQLGKLSVWNNILGDDWYKADNETKKKWIWNEFWDKIVDCPGGLREKFSKDELIKLRKAWPTLLDMLLTFVGYDYETKVYDTTSQVMVGTLAYNATSILQTHYPEVMFAWLRTADTYYDEYADTGSTGPQIVNITTNVTPTVTYSVNGEKYSGDVVLNLSTTTKGASIYYKLTTTENGVTTESTWLPFNRDLVLREPAEEGKTITYKVDTRSVYCGNTGTEQSQTYTVGYAKRYDVYVTVNEKNPMYVGDYKAGESVTLPTKSIQDELDNYIQGKIFNKWECVTNNVTIDEEAAKKEVLTFTMPEGDVTLNAVYMGKISTINITGLDSPVGGQAFDTEAQASLKSDSSSELKNVEVKVQWAVVETADDGQETLTLVSDANAGFNKKYQAIIAVNQVDGEIVFADTVTVTVTVDGQTLDAAKVERIADDGSLRIYCCETTTAKAKLTAQPTVPDITVQQNTAAEAIPHPTTVLIQTEDGEKVADVSGWTCIDAGGYVASTPKEYHFTGTINLGALDIERGDELTNTVTVNEIVKVMANPMVAVPQLAAGSPAPGTYHDNQTVKFNMPGDATIMYKLNGSENYQEYNSKTGISLTAQWPNTETYTINAYAMATDSQHNDSSVVEFTYIIAPQAVVTINCVDTGMETDSGSWTKSYNYTFTAGDKISLVAPDCDDEQFSHWEVREGDAVGLVTDANKNNRTITVDSTQIEQTASLTAVYNPIVKEISIEISKPETGKALAQSTSKGTFTVTKQYTFSEYKLVLPITWTPASEGTTESVALPNTAYTAKLTMPMSSNSATFYTAKNLTLSVTDGSDANNGAGESVLSKYKIETDDQGNAVLAVYAVFNPTAKSKAVSVSQLDSVTVASMSDADAIEQTLDKDRGFVPVKLEDGNYVNAAVTWSVPTDYNPSLKGEELTVLGTLSNLPDYVDASDLMDASSNINTSITVYVSAAVRSETPTASIPGGVYMSAQSVTLTAAEGADIYYTTDGSTPTTSSTKYDRNKAVTDENGQPVMDGNGNPVTRPQVIEVSKNMTLRAIAVEDGKQESPELSCEYYIHTHADSNKDGWCDGIDTGKKDEQNNPVLESCDTVILGKSNDTAENPSVIPGSLYRDEENGTIYVDVSASNMETNYTTEVYPITNLKYAYEKDESGTVTEEHGYIFAGWYYAVQETTTAENETTTVIETLEPCSSFPVKTSSEEGTAEIDSTQAKDYYAKFVDASVLTVKAQILAGTTAESEKTNMRFVTTVDSLNYQSVGFEIKYNEKVLNPSSNTVFKTIKAVDTNEQKTLIENAKEAFDNMVSEYFLSYRIDNIPKKAFEVEFTVTPSWVTLDGTKVVGETAKKHVCDGYLARLKSAETNASEGSSNS